MAAPLHPLIPATPEGRPSRKAGFALSSAAALLLAACLQTDPGTPTPGNTTTVPPEDNGRRAGASSSTNWPTELGDPRVIKIRGSSGPLIQLFFYEFQLTPPAGDRPAKVSGKLSIYRAGTIPALETPSPKVIEFHDADTLRIPSSFLDSVSSSKDDTARFNILVEAESMQAWLMGYSYSKKDSRIIQSPLSDSSAKPVFFKAPRYYFKGNLKVDTSLIPSVTGNSEFSFYIPGTPIFGKAEADFHFEIGPLPLGEYPLRFLRLNHPSAKPGESLVEAWEVLIVKGTVDSSLSPGAKVFSVRTQGHLSLRSSE